MAAPQEPATRDAGRSGEVAGAGGTRIAGLAGMAFAVSVVAQNVWAIATGILPDPDATAAEVIEVFAEHDGHAILFGHVAVNVMLLGVFLAGAYQRLRRDEPVWATLGLVGGVAIMSFFAMVNLPVVALAAAGDGLAGSPELVAALWHLHGAAFAFNGLALGLALAGFSLAAVGAGLVPRWFRVVGPAGAAVIIAASVPVQAGAEGEPATMVAVVGFLAWVLFLLVFGARLQREA